MDIGCYMDRKSSPKKTKSVNHQLGLLHSINSLSIVLSEPNVTYRKVASDRIRSTVTNSWLLLFPPFEFMVLMRQNYGKSVSMNLALFKYNTFNLTLSFYKYHILFGLKIIRFCLELFLNP